MNPSLLRSVFLLLLFAVAVSAHVPDNSPLNIPIGETREFHITADVDDEPKPSKYRFVSSSTPGVASVVGRIAFSQPKFGNWIIRGDKIGTTVMKFRWDYPPNKAGADVFLTVNVVPTGDTSATNAYNLTVADPVNSRTGEYFAQEATDLALGGPMPLAFSRYYASRLGADGVPAGALGANRLHNFDASLTVKIPNRRVEIRTARGRVIPFEKRGFGRTWSHVGRRDAVHALLEEDGLFYFFSPAIQMVWIFDDTGKLVRITDGRGNTHSLSYTGSQLATVSDGLGRTLTFTYTSGRITRVTDHSGRHVDFTYADSNLASASDALGKTTTYQYDASGLLTSYTRPEGNTPFTQVHTDGRVTSQTERGTDITSMAYADGSTTITQPGGASMVHDYTATGELGGFTDEGGKRLTTTSDPTGRRDSITDREGSATRITYHASSGLPATIVNAQGGTHTITYKPRVLKLAGVADRDKALTFFDIASVRFPDGASESFAYDAAGNVLTRTDRAGKKWSVTYNPRGQPLTATNPTGGVLTFTYDSAGNRTSARDSASAATEFTYDALNRVVTITHPGNATLTFTYDACDRLLTATDERGKTTTHVYDDNGRLVSATDPAAHTALFAYDSLDRIIQFTDRLGRVSSRTFDARRLISTVTDRNNFTTTFAHDERQRTISGTDAGGQTWTLGFDHEALLTSAASPINGPGVLRRNALGRIVEASNSLGHTVGFTRDSMQRVIQMIDPLGRSTAFTYDPRGDLTSVAVQGGGSAKYVRDGLGNVTSITAPDGGVWRRSYTPEGRASSATDPLGNVWTQTYDTRGRLATVAFPDAVTQSLSYDAANNLTRSQFSGGPDFQFTYDDLDRVLSATDTTTPGSAIVLSYEAEGRLTQTQQDGLAFGATYDFGGRLITASHNNNALVVTYTYDSRNRLTGVSDNVSGASVTFSHNDAGRVTGMSRANGVGTTFTYDDAGRLGRIQHGAVVDIQYQRNAAGDRTSEDIVAPLVLVPPAGTDTLTFGKAGEITTAGYAYDSRGRLTAAPGGTFTWDHADRLVQVGGFPATYNAFGEIISRGGPEGTTRYYHHHAIAGSPITAERAPNSATVTRYYIHTPGGVLLYAVDAASANAVSYYHSDQLGSTVVLTNAAGAVTDSYAHGPFGENAMHQGNSTQPFTWLGALGVRKDGEFFHMRARWYDPVSACFLSRDPRPPRLMDVASLNPYAYANGNPLRFVDPQGGKTFTLPHILERSGKITNSSHSFDTGIFMTYTGLPTGVSTGPGAQVDVFLFDTESGSPISQEGDGPAWAKKSGAVGIGNDSALHSTNGLSIRTYTSPVFGIGISFGFALGSSSGGAETALDLVIENAACFGGAVHSNGRQLLKSGLDPQSSSASAFTRGLQTPHIAYWQRGFVTDTDDSDLTEIFIASGLVGEYFPTQYLSLFTQCGIALDFLGEDEVGAPPLIDPPSDESAILLSLTSQLEGAPGFTVWFK